jgi:uncharacterized protein YndB with AHSA1/START domain
MPFQEDPRRIVWRVHIAAPLEAVYDTLATDAGRASFWAESAIEMSGVIHFVFPDGSETSAPIVRAERPRVFALDYFGSRVTFRLSRATDVELIDERTEDREEVTAGWVSVLMQLKAAIQFGVDLRNHSRERSWERGYVEN